MLMAGTPEGQVESIHEGEATPTNDLSDEDKREIVASPRMPVEQLKVQHREIKKVRLELDLEGAELD